MHTFASGTLFKTGLPGALPLFLLKDCVIEARVDELVSVVVEFEDMLVGLGELFLVLVDEVARAQLAEPAG